MLHVLWEAVVGLMIGALAKLAMPGEQFRSIMITMVIGVAGSIAGGWLGVRIGLYHVGQRAAFIASLLGAVVLLTIYGFLKCRRRGPCPGRRRNISIP